MSLIGRTVDSYRITQRLGEGGMGAVYRATDNIEREVAIKVLAPQLQAEAWLWAACIKPMATPRKRPFCHVVQQQ